MSRETYVCPQILRSVLSCFHSAQRRKGILLALGIAATPLAQLSAAQNVVLDFENLPQAPVIAQYASKGVTFNGQMLRDYSQTPGFTHSGHNAVELCFASEFC